MANGIDAILDGEGAGFVPARPEDPRAAWEAAQRGAPAEVDEPAEEPAAEAALEEPAEPAEPAAPQRRAPAAAEAADPSDLAVLRAAGWSADDLKELSPEAAARHALRESGRGGKPAQDVERAEEPSDPDGIEAMLAEEFSSKTAKRLAPVLRKIAEGQAALARGVREQTLAGLRERNLGSYPELARPEVERAVLSVAGANPSLEQYQRALRVLYGARQAPDERAEARAQVNGQMNGGRRGPAQQRDPEDAKRAAWKHYTSTGDADKAVALRRRLGG